MLAYSGEMQMQVRAQNAAFAAASAMAGLQSNKLNQLEAQLYAASLDEFRIRRTIDGMLLTVHRSGGCDPNPPPPAASGTSGLPSDTSLCIAIYNDLRPRLATLVGRYDAETAQLNAFLASTSYRAIVRQARQLLKDIPKDCTPAGSLDCQFNYTAIPVGGSILAPVAPANYFVHDTLFQRVQTGAGGPPSYEPSLSPLSAEVVTCQKVPLLAGIPFIGTAARPGPTYTVVGRAAARSIPAVQEWFVPGPATPGGQGRYTPLSGLNLQPFEPATGADKLSADINRTVWEDIDPATGAYVDPPVTNVFSPDSFDVQFSDFPVWNNPNANGGAGGFNITYATGTFIPLSIPLALRYGHMPYSTFSAFTVWWSTAAAPVTRGKLTEGVDYAC
jgi:hypothetical protein